MLKLFIIVLLEGFVTISAEILTIRQLIPFVGSSVVITSIIIGVFLLFLAYGYRRGGQVSENHAYVLMRNFIIAAILISIGMSYFAITYWFHLWQTYVTTNSLYPLLSYLLIVTAPLVYLLGQTVPLTLHLFPNSDAIKTGLLGGRILHINTLGSFLGAVLTSVLLFSLLGVAWTVTINVLVLLGLALVLGNNVKQWVGGSVAFLLIMPAAFVVNVVVEHNHFLKTNHYANYRVSTFISPQYSVKQFEINNSYSSMLDSYDRGFPYIEIMKRILFDEMNMRDKDILVLGAGGFTLSKTYQDMNRFVYLDIDPDIKIISEDNFSGPIVGEFVAEDARKFLNTTNEQFDAIIVDAYNSPLAIPQHLVTEEYFNSLHRALKPNGVVLLNLIANAQFGDDYTRRVDNTIRSALGFCTSQPLTYQQGITNIVYVCYPEHRDEGGVYTDNLNTATLDAFKMKY